MRIKVARISLGERCPSVPERDVSVSDVYFTITYFLTKKMDNTSLAIKDTYRRLWGNDDIFQLLANDIKNGHKLTWDSKIYWRKGSCLKFCSFYLLEERIQGLVKYLPGEGIASRNSPPSIWAGQRHARIWLEYMPLP